MLTECEIGLIANKIANSRTITKKQKKTIIDRQRKEKKWNYVKCLIRTTKGIAYQI